MNHPPLTLRQVLKQKLVPVGKNQLMKLVHQGELKKAGNLKHTLNYIRAINVGSGEKRARWAIEPEEIQAWIDRARDTQKR